jgi:uncharacterized membrane protein
MNARPVNLVLAGSLAAALATLTVPAGAQDASKEKCFGVALKGQNDCAAGSHDCAGHSKVNYDGQSFKLVAKGTCVSMKTPLGHGSLDPTKRPG